MSCFIVWREITCPAWLWLRAAEPGNESTSKVTIQQPGIRMLDYDLKLPFTFLKTKNVKLERSVSLALAPSSGKVSEKQAFGESHAWGCWRLEMRGPDNLKKVSSCMYTAGPERWELAQT